MNITKRGVSSLSLGGRGATLNVGSRGVRQTVGIPGTGLSYTTISKNAHPLTSHDRSAVQIAESSIPRLELTRFDIAPRPVSSSRTLQKGAVLALGVFLSLLSLGLSTPWGWIGLICIGLGWILPSRKKLEAAENQRCQKLAQVELGRRLTQFREAADKATNTAPSVRSILALQEKMALTDDEVGRHTIATFRGIASLSEYEELVSANGGRLPTLEGHEMVVTSDACYFVTPATYDKRGDNDPSGSLYLSSEQLIFVAREGVTAAPWTKVMSVDCDDRVLRVQRRDRQTPYLFDLPSVGDAFKAKYIANRILSLVTHPARPSIESGTAAGSQPQLEKSVDLLPPTAVTVAATTADRQIDLGTGHGYTLGIVGESYRQTALRALAGDRRRRGEEVIFIAVLSPEPENSYDSNAVRVDIEGGDQIGYLSREDAVAYRDVLSAVSAQHAVAVCRAKLIGGTTNRPSIGAMLDLRAPDELLAILSNVQPF